MSPCNEKIVRALGEVIENVHGKIGLGSDKQRNVSTSDRGSRSAINSPTYVSKAGKKMKMMGR